MRTSWRQRGRDAIPCSFFFISSSNLELIFNSQLSCRPRPSNVTFFPCLLTAEAIALILGRNALDSVSQCSFKKTNTPHRKMSEPR